MRQPTGHTHLYAVLADPVEHVRAPEFCNPRLAEQGLDAFIVPLHVKPETLSSTVATLAQIGNLKGLIITIPHKETMARLCHELGPDARLIGAVNTVRIEDGGHLVGEMFDGTGLVAAMRAHGIEIEGRRVLLLGAGGAGRAIAFALAQTGVAALTIANRTVARAEALVEDVRAALPGTAAAFGPADPADHDLIINATSLGIHAEDPPPLDPAALAPQMAVVDIVAVRDTALMQTASARGLRKVMGGRPMIEHQIDAQIAFLRPSPPD